MNSTHLRTLYLVLLLLLLVQVSALPAANQDFDGGGTPFGVFGDATAPVAGGPTGAFGQLTPAANNQFGRIGFDQAIPGNTFTAITGELDFRAIPGSGQADGMSLYLLPATGVNAQGTSGDFAIVDTSELGRADGAFGIGLNIHNGGGDLSNNSLYTSFNGASVGQVNLPFDISTSEFHRAIYSVQFSPTGGASVDISLIQDINGAAGGPSAVQPVVQDLFIPDFHAHAFRTGFAARTGGQNADQQVDNIVTSATAPANATVQDFDNAGTPFTTGGVASVVAGGPTGALGQLTPATGSVEGRFGFDQTVPDANFGRLSARVDFRAIPGADAGGAGQADGFGLVFIPTTGPDGQGASGDFTFVNAAEFGRIAGGFGVGFNIHNGGEDISDNSIHLTFDGATVAQLDAPFDFSTTEFHRAFVNVDFLPGGDALVDVSLVQDINGAPSAAQVVFDDELISGLSPYEFRVGLMGRTGGQNADQSFDNLVVATAVPEPSSIALSLLAMAGLAAFVVYRRRNAPAA